MKKPAFNTLLYSKKLQEAGIFPSQTAEKFIEIQEQIISDSMEPYRMIRDDISKLSAKFDIGFMALRTDIDILKKDGEELKIDSATHKADLTILKEDVTTLKENIITLKSDVSTLKEDVTTLKADVSILKIDVHLLKADVATLKEDVSTIKQDVAALKTGIINLGTELRAEMKNLQSWLIIKLSLATAGIAGAINGIAHYFLHF